MVIVTASGIFGEMQSALNATWDVKPPDQPWWSLIRARAASLGLVAALGFVTMVSLAASAALSALGQEAGRRILRMIGGEHFSGVERLPCTLMVRESCGAQTKTPLQEARSS
jgi:uncharacterized BrkB/YihY/UPF0761 family membrane protein